jgi:hypothetical protein
VKARRVSGPAGLWSVAQTAGLGFAVRLAQQA